MNPPAIPPLPAMPLDDTALERLRALDPDGRNGVLARVLATFEASLTRTLGQLAADLAAASAGSSAAALATVAHTLKSSSASVGALRLAAACAEVERSHRGLVGSAQRHDVERLIAEGEAALVAVRTMLKDRVPPR